MCPQRRRRTALTQLSGDVSLASFCPEGFVGIGVPIGTDAFIQNFVAKTCRSIIDDVDIHHFSPNLSHSIHDSPDQTDDRMKI